MDVNGPSPVQPSIPIQSTQAADNVQQAADAGSVAPQDELEISQAARMMEELDQASELHQARLDQIKQEIENGTYETPEKLEAALWQLLQRIESDNQ